MRCIATLTLLTCAFSAGASAAEQPKPLMKDFIGINGHTVQFKPDLYHPVCTVVRDYHPVEWDLGKDTDVPTTFPLARNRVDWSQVYGSWKKAGYFVDVSLMFESIKQKDWKDVPRDAKAYGLAFAKAFGPSSTKLVDSAEVGNEPGKWNDADYRTMFEAMASGLRAGDPKLTIVTCAADADKSGDYMKAMSCVQNLENLYDVINVHSYAQTENWPTWRRSFPEDPKLLDYTTRIEKLIAWRDANAKGKPVWITEFGYDASTKPAPKTGDFKGWVDVTDDQQGQWLVRSFLVFARLSVDKAYIYFFNDNDDPAFHGSSGVTRNWQPKPSYHAVAHLN
ncbi:MAG TPA: cellulase family glycosylhydrolase [Planctomycetota bacterium]|nr:cellulase family glycosylhydrolase [Planctomycetota bacterium]